MTGAQGAVVPGRLSGMPRIELPRIELLHIELLWRYFSAVI